MHRRERGALAEKKLQIGGVSTLYLMYNAPIVSFSFITPLHPNYYYSFTLEGKGWGQSPADNFWQSLLAANWLGREGVGKVRNEARST